MISELIERLEAQPEGVISEVSEADEMYRADRRDIYFEMGRSALRCIRLAMLTAGKRDVHSLLDFPCGHGRVLRMLKAEFPQARLTAGDINVDGVRFCERVFGANPIYSGLHATDVKIAEQFDLIWCGSLLTHLDLDRWHAFFSLLADCVADQGCSSSPPLVIGPPVDCGPGIHVQLGQDEIERVLQSYDRDGFGYVELPGAGSLRDVADLGPVDVPSSGNASRSSYRQLRAASLGRAPGRGDLPEDDDGAGFVNPKRVVGGFPARVGLGIPDQGTRDLTLC
jgi:hypothetical protein